MHIDTRADEKFIIGFIRTGSGFVFPQRLDTDIQGAVDELNGKDLKFYVTGSAPSCMRPKARQPRAMRTDQ